MNSDILSQSKGQRQTEWAIDNSDGQWKARVRELLKQLGPTWRAEDVSPMTEQRMHVTFEKGPRDPRDTRIVWNLRD